jgi:hypothetical protein
MAPVASFQPDLAALRLF